MTVEVAIVISVLSLLLSIYKTFSDVKRGTQQDSAADAASLTTVIVKLESIGQGVSEIKSDLNNVKSDIQDMRERVVKVEESTKQAHKRADTLENRLEKCGICHEHEMAGLHE